MKSHICATWQCTVSRHFTLAAVETPFLYCLRNVYFSGVVVTTFLYCDRDVYFSGAVATPFLSCLRNVYFSNLIGESL